MVRNRRVAAHKDPARTDVPQFSERAVFDAAVNALVHRDYAVSGSRIRLFNVRRPAGAVFVRRSVQFHDHRGRLTDSLGACATLWFREMVGTSCVFDYRYTG